MLCVHAINKHRRKLACADHPQFCLRIDDFMPSDFELKQFDRKLINDVCREFSDPAERRKFLADVGMPLHWIARLGPTLPRTS